jgi:branched-chain amino acid transport system permease protein
MTMALRPSQATAIDIVLVFALVLGASTLIGSSSFDRFLTETFIYVLAVLGLQIFIGNSGIVSFGHAAFMLVAAYVSAWQSCCFALKPVFMPDLPQFLLGIDVEPLLAGVVGAAVAAAVSLVAGLILLRLSPVGTSIGLFAMLAMVVSFYQNWTGWTGGATSLVGLPTYVTPLVAIAWSALAVVVALLFRDSRWGLQLRASQDDKTAAEASGVRVLGVRLLALSISAFFVGMAGVLFGHFVGTLSVQFFWLDMTFLTLAMLIAGGRRSVTGAIVGVILVRSVTDLFRGMESGISLGGTSFSIPSGTQEVILAISILLILIFRPGGLLGARELRWPLR